MTTRIAEPTTNVIGARLKRVEDPRLITGAAKYIDDLKLPGIAYVAILRSPHAHARITSIDTTKAAAHPGVVAVYTGKDFEHLPALPCAWQAAGVDNFVATPRVLELDRVTFTGAGVAAVVAETRAAAEDGLALVAVEWEPLETVVGPERAVAEGAPQLHEVAPRNIVMEWECGDGEATDKALAEKLGRPVKWIESRRENYAATTHGRDHVTHLKVGANRDGTITALKAKTYANLGGILSTIAPGIPTTLYGRMLSGAYRIPNIHCEVTGVYTNTGMVDAYRGAGRPEATYAVERAVDLVARELDLDPVEVRRANFIPPDAFPYDPAGILAGLEYDSGDYDKTLTRALELLDYDDFRARQAEARQQGRYLGVGFSTYVEICGVAPSAWIGTVGQGWGASMWESANVRVHLTGKVVVTTGSLSHGQGHETTLTQIAASELGVPVEDVTVELGDTLGTPFGYGSYGSRSAAVGGVALYQSLQRIKAKARRIAAHMLEAHPDDVELENGRAFVKGSPAAGKTIQEIAGAAALAYDLPEGEEPFLDDTAYYDPPNCTFPFGAHIAVVAVDADTGEVKVERYVAVDDVGSVINPMIVDGQLQGGIVQGVAQALCEGAVYDEHGQLLTSSLMEYAVPRADFLPRIELDRTETPTTVNPLGVKGVGEAGTIASTPAVANAVMDALAPLGISHVDMPLTPERVWRAMQAAKNGGE